MSKRIVIIGGGVIGLATAWYCLRRGHHVTLIERHPDARDGCSFGNAGMIVPSHVVPLAAPGMIRRGLKWMGNPESPFYIRPRASADLIRWLWLFKKACTQNHVARAAPLLRDLHLESRDCFDQLESEMPGGFGMIKNGLLMLCKTERSLDEEAETSAMAERIGVEARVLSAKETTALDPAVEMNVHGAVYYRRDCHLSPNHLMEALEIKLAELGCEFHWNTECTGFATEGNRIRSVATTLGSFDADEFVLCSGVWSTQIANQLSLSLPMQAGKGYSVTLEKPTQIPSICSILCEARVAVTPMGTSLRFGGTMEIAGIDESITESRVRGIVHSIPRYFPRFSIADFDHCEPWVGLRPCSPDGLPYLGRTSKWENILISTGHAMMGISLAMISGRIVAESIDGVSSKINDLELLSPDRFTR